MVDHLHLNSELFMRLVATAGSAFGIIGFFIIFQYIFELDFSCPCKEGTNLQDCIIYMVLPALTLMLFSLLIDTGRTRTCSWYIFSTCSKGFWLIMCRSVSVAMLWMITAFIDGDWYVCLKLNSGTFEEQLHCKNKDKWTKEETVKFRIYVNESRLIGLVLLGFLVLGWLCGTCRSEKEYTEYLKKQLVEEVNDKIEDKKGKADAFRARQENAQARQEEAKTRQENAKDRQKNAKDIANTSTTGQRQTVEDIEARQEEDIQEKTKTPQEKTKAGQKDAKAIATTSTTGQRQTTKQEEAKTRQEEAKARQEEAKARKEEAKTGQKDATVTTSTTGQRQTEEDLEVRQEEAKARQEEAKARQEEAKAFQEAAKDEQEEAKAELEELKARREEDTAEEEEGVAKQEEFKAKQDKDTRRRS